MTPTMVNPQFFFCCFVFYFCVFFFLSFFVVVVVVVLLLFFCFCFCFYGGCNKLFSFLYGRGIYLKMRHIMRQTVFAICEQQRRRSACASADGYEVLQLKAIWLDCLQPVSFRKASYRYMYIWLSLSFTLQERYTPILFPCRCFCDNLFDKT